MAKLRDLTTQKFNKLTPISYDKIKSKWLCLCDCGNKKYIRANHIIAGTISSCGCSKGKQNIIDRTGVKYGMLTCLNQITDNGRIKWVCRCDCGKTTIVKSDNLANGHTKSCGCYIRINNQNRIIDLAGKKIGRLTVLFMEEHIRPIRWICKCECGKQVSVRSTCLVKNETLSCGCYLKDMMKEIATTHGLSKTRLYNIWHGMMTRCYNLNSIVSKNYGVKGISVCEEWHDFNVFIDWAKINGYEPNLSIDRFPDKKGNYSPTNCRWATRSEQALNTSRNITPEQVLSTRELVKSGISRKAIAKMVGIGLGSCNKIIHGKIYSNII